MKRLLFLGNLALISTLHAESPKGSVMLDKIISHPGSYSQMCGLMSMPSDIPFHPFQISGYKGASISKANLTLIEKNREPLVEAIRARLAAVDLSKPAKQPDEDPAPERNLAGETFGSDPATLNPFLLEVIQKTHATEALPGLFVLEDKLAKGIGAAAADEKIAPPVVDGWFVANQGDMSTAPINRNDFDRILPERKDPTPVETAKLDHDRNLFNSRVAQRDVLMTIALLMREKAYPPYLKTGFETAYVDGLKASAKEDGFDTLKPGDPLPPELEGRKIRIDEITKLPIEEYSSIVIPYSPESRDEIRAAAAQWITEHP